MPTKNIGPKGQIVIPKRMRDAIGIKPGVDVTLEIRENEIVITKPKIETYLYINYIYVENDERNRLVSNGFEYLIEQTRLAIGTGVPKCCQGVQFRSWLLGIR